MNFLNLQDQTNIVIECQDSIQFFIAITIVLHMMGNVKAKLATRPEGFKINNIVFGESGFYSSKFKIVALV